MVGAVEDGEVLPVRRRVGRRAQAQDARNRALGLVLFRVAIDDAYRLAFAQLRKQGFRKQLGVGLDHIVGRAQDGTGGAVVLLQLDDLELGVVDRQLLEVVQGGAAPAVNALVVIAHGGEMAALAHQQLEQLVLGGIGVLVFIDQHMAQMGLPFGAHLGVVAQQAQRHADEVVKVHALVGGQPLFIALHDDGNGALVVIGGLGQGFLVIEAHVFPLADGPLPLAGGGHIGGATSGILDDADHVIAVEDAELRLEPQHMAVFAHHLHAQRVEGADQHILGLAADEALGALAHLGRRLVGEGDGGNLARRHAGLDQAGNLVGDDPGLARSGAGQYQARALGVVHGL